MLANKFLLYPLLLLSVLAVGVRGGEEPKLTPAQQVKKEVLQPKAEAPKAAVAAPLVDDPKAAEEEASANTYVKSASAAPQKTGSAEYLSGKDLIDTSIEEAAARTLVRNLTIKFQEQGYARAVAGIQQAKGVYDPVVGFNLQLQISQSYARSHFVNRTRFDGDLLEEQFLNFQNAFEDGTAGGVINPVIIADGVALSGLINPGPFRPFGDFDSASFRSKFLEWNTSVTLAQSIPWGATFDITLAQRHSKTHVPSPVGNRPWATDLSINLTVPVPGFKDWGPYGPTDVGVKLARKSKERAYWSLQAAINGNLLAVTNQYWELVRTIRRVEVAAQTVKNLEGIGDNVKKMLDVGKATKYEEIQVASELARVRSLEQDAWQAYLVASNNLKAILDYEREVVLVPHKYSKRLYAEFPHTAADAVRVAIDGNPDLRGSQTDLELAEITLKFEENQAKPDLKIVTGISYTQDNGTFGYRDQGSSLGHVVKPDAKNNFIGLTYRVPWGNKPAEERLRQARQTYLQAEKNTLKVANQTERRVTDALSGLNAARKRVELSRKARDSAERVYSDVVKLWNEGRVPPLAANKSYPAFELLRKNNDLLNARFLLIDALTAYKQAEAELLSAEGALTSRYSSEMDIRLRPVEEIQIGEVPPGCEP